MTDIPKNVEKLARRLAEADGFDPEEIARGGPNDFEMQRKNFNGYALGVRGPVWQTYARQANLMITAEDFFRRTSRSS